MCLIVAMVFECVVCALSLIHSVACVYTNGSHHLMFVTIRDGLFNSILPHVGIHLHPLSGVNRVFAQLALQVFEDTIPDVYTAGSTVAYGLVLFFRVIYFAPQWFLFVFILPYSQI